MKLTSVQLFQLVSIRASRVKLLKGEKKLLKASETSESRVEERIKL